MTKKVLLSIAFLLMLIDFSSCTMRGVSGTPYHVWHSSKGFHRHWGRERHLNTRRQFWGNHRSGMRPYKNRGHFRY